MLVLQKTNRIAFIGAIVLLTMFSTELLLAGVPIKLNGPLVAGGSVVDFPQFTPDGSKVIYLADQNTDEIVELYSVDSGGSTPVKLNSPLAAGTSVSKNDGQGTIFQLSPDGSDVYYSTGGGINELFSVPSGGGTPLKLNGPIGNGDRITDLTIAMDDGRAFFTVRDSSGLLADLYSVAAEGGSVAKLNEGLPGNSESATFVIPGSSNVLIRVANGTPTEFHEDSIFYIVPREGGLSTKFAELPLLSGIHQEPPVQVSPDGSRVIYTTYNNVSPDVVGELFSVPITGGPAAKLSGAMVPGGDIFWLTRFSPNGNRIVYRADQHTNDVFELYSVPSAGGDVIKLNGLLPTGGGVIQTQYPISPDGTQILYIADQDTDGVAELYSVSIAGGVQTKLNGPLVTGGDVSFHNLVDAGFFSPDGNHVVYRADQDMDEVHELYSVPSAGGTPVKLNGSLVAGGDVAGKGLTHAYTVAFNPDGSRILYVADQEVDETHELYIVPTTGGRPVKINGPLTAEVDIVPDTVLTSPNRRYRNFQISPDGSRVLFAVAEDGVREIYTRLVRQQWKAAEGDWDVPANWSHGEVPDEVMQVSIEGEASVAATGNSFQRLVNELHLGGGVGTSRLELVSNAAITAINGVEIEANGILTGNGSIVGDVNNFGITSPGASAGILHVDGDYIQSTAGKLRVDLAGPGVFDQLLLTGAATLDGIIDVSLVNFAPQRGDVFEILTAASGVSGRFAQALLPVLADGLQFDVRYSLNRVDLVVVAVPETSALVLVAFTIVTIVLQARRRLPVTSCGHRE